MLQKPDSYNRDTESFYLSWIEYGEKGQKAIASQKLLEIEVKVQYDVTYKLWTCETNDLIKHSLLLALFDQKPETHYEAVTKLLTTKGDSGLGSEIRMKPLDGYTPEPFTKDLEYGYNLLYFDWGDNAAIRLLKRGYLSDLSFKMLLEIAADSMRYSHREEARQVFDLFENIPAYEIAPKINLKYGQFLIGKSNDELIKYARQRQKQLKEIKRWYQTNKSKLKWSPEKKKYIVSQ